MLINYRRLQRNRLWNVALSLALVVFLAFTTSPVIAADMTKSTFVAQCAGENSLGSKPACVCVWSKIDASYKGEERKLMTKFFTTRFADWEPTRLTEKEEDQLLEESFKLVDSCGVDIKP